MVEILTVTSPVAPDLKPAYNSKLPGIPVTASVKPPLGFSIDVVVTFLNVTRPYSFSGSPAFITS